MATATSVDEGDWGEDGVVRAKIGTFSTESFHGDGDGDVSGRRRLGRGRRCSRQNINL